MGGLLRQVSLYICINTSLTEILSSWQNNRKAFHPTSNAILTNDIDLEYSCPIRQYIYIQYKLYLVVCNITISVSKAI